MEYFTSSYVLDNVIAGGSFSSESELFTLFSMLVHCGKMEEKKSKTKINAKNETQREMKKMAKVFIIAIIIIIKIHI